MKLPISLDAVAIGVAGIQSVPAETSQQTERGLAEQVVREYEFACEQFDFDKANALLAPGARWIEDSLPEPAAFTGEGWSKHWQEMKEAKVRIHYRIHDVDTHIRGDVAWVTLVMDANITADNPAAIALNGNAREWYGVFVESYTLEREQGKWRVALGHTSLLPNQEK